MNNHGEAHGREYEDAAVRSVLEHLPAIWSDVTSGRASADAIAAMFTEDASFIVGDGTYLRGRSDIAAYYRRTIEGQVTWGASIKDTTVVIEVDTVQFLGDNVAVVFGHGGILFAGETDVPSDRRGIQTSVVTKVDGTWLAAAYQNTRIHQYPATSE